MIDIPSPQAAASKPKGLFLQGLRRGIAGKCPNCGQGKLYRSYLNVEPRCSVCSHDNIQYRADDAGPYFTILIVGHLVVGPMLFFPFIWKSPIALVLCTTLPIIAILTLVLLPVVKGGVIGARRAIRTGKGEGDAEAEAIGAPSVEPKLEHI